MTAYFDQLESEAFKTFDSRIEADRLGTMVRERRSLRSLRTRQDILQKMIELVGERELEYR